MKTAFLTGGSSGIGQAIKLLLEENGWEVIAPSHKELDLSRLDTVADKTAQAVKDAVTIQSVIHVAGIWHDEQAVFRKDLEDYTPEQVAATLNVGLTGFMIALSRLLPKMPKDGAVVGISGTFADGASGWLPYYVSKRGLEDLLIGLSQDYPNGPRVYGVSPADTATEAYARFFPEHTSGAQPPEAVAQEVYRLLTTAVPTGSVVEVRHSVAKPGFHK
jgi:NAD(P)-dependent dehydrogenase (short-subunit alcohol dehydrogenase family)